MPLYYAVDLHRLPPVDMKHCDVSAILAELQRLRADVPAVNQLRDEVSALQHEVLQLKQCHRDSVGALLPVNDFPPLTSQQPTNQPQGATAFCVSEPSKAVSKKFCKSEIC